MSLCNLTHSCCV